MQYLEQIVVGFEYVGIFYFGLYLVVYLVLAIFSFFALRDYYHNSNFLKNEVLVKSNHTIGVSIIAPAYNEVVTIVYSVRSLLAQEYPKFEVIIVNDGSTDGTLEEMIREFDLVKVNFLYKKYVRCKPVKGHYRSTNPAYAKLLVVDKVNGGSKADGSNAGINSAQYPVFICTDADCILRRDTISCLVRPFVLGKKRTIATGGMIRISNACEFKDGMLKQSHFPTNFFARFQENEYLRSYLFGRMAWGKINALLLVSGGLGMFDREVAIAAGGYWHKSFGEDIDLILRMRQLMHRKGEDFVIKYVPETLCWTEVPDTLSIFLRQRTRWGRGLIQTLNIHRKVLFNPKYGVTGNVAFPYYVLFELLSPIMELLGFMVLIINLIFFDVSVELLLLMTAAVYLYFSCITLLSVMVDQFFFRYYASVKEMRSLLLTVALEPILYHPIIVYSFLKGYFYYLTKKTPKWGAMNRKGFSANLPQA